MVMWEQLLLEIWVTSECDYCEEWLLINHYLETHYVCDGEDWPRPQLQLQTHWLWFRCCLQIEKNGISCVDGGGDGGGCGDVERNCGDLDTLGVRSDSVLKRECMPSRLF